MKMFWKRIKEDTEFWVEWEKDIQQFRKKQKEKNEIEEKNLKRILYILGGIDNIDFKNSEDFCSLFGELQGARVYLKDYGKVSETNDKILRHLGIERDEKKFTISGNYKLRKLIKCEKDKIEKKEQKEQKIEFEKELEMIDMQIESEKNKGVDNE